MFLSFQTVQNKQRAATRQAFPRFLSTKEADHPIRLSNHKREDPINTKQRKHKIPQNPRLGTMNKDVIYHLLFSTTQGAN